MTLSSTLDYKQTLLPLEPNRTDLADHLTLPEKICAVIMYSVVSALAFCGNVGVIFLVWKFQKLRSPTNYLIANLALADMLMALFCIPFSYWPSIIIVYWPFGEFMCKFITYSQPVTILTSAYTLVAISLDRFIAITFPLKASWKLTKTKALLVILSVWVGAALVCLPFLIVLQIVEEDQLLQCTEVWSPNEEAKLLYTVALLVIQFVVPFVVFVVTYTVIGLKIWYSAVPGEGNADVSKDRKDSVKKMIPTMMIVTSVFAITWIPINVLNIILSVNDAASNYKHIRRIWWACNFFETLHSFVNPLIYVSRNRRFRDGFAYFYRFLPCVKYSDGMNRLSNAANNTYCPSTFGNEKKWELVPMATSDMRATSNGGPADNRHLLATPDRRRYLSNSRENSSE